MLSDKGQLYLKLIEASPDGYIVVDETGIIVFANTKAKELLYNGNPEIIGQKMGVPIVKEETSELELPSNSGEVKMVEMRTVEITWKAKKAYLYNLRDITIQKQAEIALQKNEERFRVALSDSSIIVWQQDLNLHYTWSCNAQNFLKTNEIIGKTDKELIENRVELQQLIKIKQSVINTQTGTSEEVQTIRNQSPYYYKLNVEPFYDINNKLKGITCMALNITELKVAYKKLEIAVQKAKESDKLKSAFLANMSHEIRTPMNGIMGFTDLLKKPELSGERQQEFINIIQESGERMLNIIDELVDIAKIEAGQEEIHKSEFLLNEILTNLHAFFSNESSNKGITFTINKNINDSASVIITDKTKLNQILTNLIKNAIKYTDKGTIELGYTINYNMVEFYVKDTGIGIPTNQQKQIFERFRQADLTTSREYEGGGLGLSISKAYVEMLGGKIWLTSEEGKGSTFFFTIPCQTPILEEFKKQDDTILFEKSWLNGLTFLVAEDDDTSYMLLEELLEDTSLKLIRAENGVMALKLIENNPNIDLVLMDIKMPEMDGYQATEIIRKKYPTLPIIAQTAFASKADKKKAIRAGCNGYISKPIKEEELIAVLTDHYKPSKLQ